MHIRWEKKSTEGYDKCFCLLFKLFTKTTIINFFINSVTITVCMGIIYHIYSHYRNKNGTNGPYDLLPLTISSQSSDEKCFTIDMPEVKNGTVKSLEIKVTSQIFKDIEATLLKKISEVGS